LEVATIAVRPLSPIASRLDPLRSRAEALWKNSAYEMSTLEALSRHSLNTPCL
jgi:hypothetical protein